MERFSFSVMLGLKIINIYHEGLLRLATSSKKCTPGLCPKSRYFRISLNTFPAFDPAGLPCISFCIFIHGKATILDGTALSTPLLEFDLISHPQHEIRCKSVWLI